MKAIKIAKLTIKESSKVLGGGETRGFSPEGTTGTPTIDVCSCCCACIPDISTK